MATMRTRSSARRSESGEDSDYDVVELPEPSNRRRPPPPPPRLPRTLVAADNRQTGEEKDDTSSGDPPAPPPPPPPPPPLPAEEVQPENQFPNGQPEQQGQAIADIGVQTEALPEWHLQLRRGPFETQPHRDLVYILVSPSMTIDLLSKCVLQASASGVEYMRAEPVVTGLFRERDRVFVPLERILEQRASREVWTLNPHRPQPPPQQQVESWFLAHRTNIILYAVFAVVVVPFVFGRVHNFGETLFEMVVNQPVRAFYRYGPAFFGWEGLPLPQICARITYQGDADFWKRNPDDCARIFAAKEEATLRTVRPIVYGTLLTVGFLAIRSLVRVYATTRRSKNMVDQEMVDTHRALNTLVRQVNRAMQQK